MKSLAPYKKACITTGALILLCLLSPAGNIYSQEPSIGEKIAEAYGIGGFGDIEEIKFTFNVKKGGTEVSRSWVWRPKQNLVTYLGDGKTDETVSYKRSDITQSESESLRETDARFINDQYWLLFPFHLVWDKDITVELENENAKFPIGGGSGRMVSVIYPPEGGYTPGDRYDLFLDDDDMIAQWIYRRGGSDIPTVTATWEDNRRVGPIILSLNHESADNSFRVWFTGVEIKLSGLQKGP